MARANELIATRLLPALKKVAIATAPAREASDVRTSHFFMWIYTNAYLSFGLIFTVMLPIYVFLRTLRKLKNMKIMKGRNIPLKRKRKKTTTQLRHLG
jgi:hypothetical protein